MTSIQSNQASSIYNLHATGGGQRSSRAAGPPSEQQQQKLGDVLASEGLSSEDQAALESDLNDALSQLFSSSDGQLDPAAVKETVSNVLEKYGIDPEELASRLGPPEGAPSGGAPQGGARAGGPPPGGGRPAGGPPPGGPPPGGSSTDAASSDSTDETDSDTDTTLEETLQDLLDRLTESDDSETTSKISNLLVSGLFGVDEVA